MTQDSRLKVIKKLDAGGMAEVYIGELVGAQGISKRVAVKRILPNLGHHQKFVSMFLDEARLAMKLSHMNVVQTFEVGGSNNNYYIVMEYIEGTSLKALANSFKEQRKKLPIGVAIYIVMEAAKGLGYAHAAKDENGVPLGLVHRDVSPPNILLSVEGEVKVVDFGLAKAASQLEDTEPGVIKGKFSYLSPEAVMGLEVDARADIFSLGIVLWELLTNRRLFYGATDLETVQLVEKAFVPRISALNPEVPPALEKTIAKALARDRERRYKKAEHFIDDLNSVLFTYGLKVSNRDVGKLVRRIRGVEEEEEAPAGVDFDFSIEGTGDFSNDFNFGSDKTTPDAPTQNEGTEDTRSWFSDMDMDDMFGEMGDEEAPAAEELSVEADPVDDEDFLSDDMLEEVLEDEDEDELMIEMEEEDEMVVSGELDSSVMKKSPLAQAPPPTPGPAPAPGEDKGKKNWFSKFFGGE